MSSETQQIEEFTSQEYKYGFVTDVDTDSVPAGLSEEIVAHISRKKEEPSWLLDWRLKAYRHWLTMTEPEWPNVHSRDGMTRGQKTDQEKTTSASSS